MARDAGLDFVRVGYEAPEIEKAYPYLSHARNLGLIPCVNMMKTYGVTPREFAQKSSQAVEAGAEIVYCVDSAGSMLPEDVARYFDAAREAVGCQFGFHGHNNLMMGVANCIAAYEHGVRFLALDGLDFSGAIYSLDTGNQVFVPAFAAGGGFGIDEFTGFPDVVLVPDATTFRVLPWADRTGWMLCDVYFSNGEPMPLDGRGLMRRMLGELGDAGYDFLAGIEIEYYIVRLGAERILPENAGFTPPPPEVSVFELGYQ